MNAVGINGLRGGLPVTLRWEGAESIDPNRGSYAGHGCSGNARRCAGACKYIHKCIDAVCKCWIPRFTCTVNQKYRYKLAYTPPERAHEHKGILTPHSMPLVTTWYHFKQKKLVIKMRC